MSQMSAESIMLEVLTEVYPHKVHMVGIGPVQMLLSGHRNFQSVKKGEKLDTTEAFNLIAASVTLLTSFIQLYLLLRTENNRLPSKEEVLEKADEEKLNTASLSDDEIDHLATTLVEKLNTHTQK